LKRAIKEVAIEKSTKNARQKLMQGPSQDKSQPKPKINVRLETEGGTSCKCARALNVMEMKNPGSRSLLQWPIRWQMTTMIVLFLGVLMSKPEKGRTAPNLIL
jgi:hypothetical protein